SYYVGNAARAARFLKAGGYIGIGFSFAGVTNGVVNTCTIGREGECGKIAVRKYSKFALGTGAGMYGGAWGGSAGLAGCAVTGIMTGGVACAAVGAFAGGYLGSKVGEKAVDFLLGSTGD
ncbi:hypothetical protein EHW66_12570, partial [Erwinia psidii]|nr:hypothetical protein [Erwinia psidii]